MDISNALLEVAKAIKQSSSAAVINAVSPIFTAILGAVLGSVVTSVASKKAINREQLRDTYEILLKFVAVNTALSESMDYKERHELSASLYAKVLIYAKHEVRDYFFLALPLLSKDRSDEETEKLNEIIADMTNAIKDELCGRLHFSFTKAHKRKQ